MSDAVLALVDEFQETEIGPIPFDWEVVVLGDLMQGQHLQAQNGFPCGTHNRTASGGITYTTLKVCLTAGAGPLPSTPPPGGAGQSKVE